MTTEPFPGVLYDGDGMRLEGAGPDTFTPAMGDALPFKMVLHDRPVTGEGGELRIGDRLWMLPDSFGEPPEMPTALIYELAGVVRAGGRVGVAGRRQAIATTARDALLLALAEIGGRA